MTRRPVTITPQIECICTRQVVVNTDRHVLILNYTFNVRICIVFDGTITITNRRYLLLLKHKQSPKMFCRGFEVVVN